MMKLDIEVRVNKIIATQLFHEMQESMYIISAYKKLNIYQRNHTFIHAYLKTKITKKAYIYTYRHIHTQNKEIYIQIQT